MSWKGAAHLDGFPEQVHDEHTFRYLLTVEHKRSERSGRPFFLLTAEVADLPEQSARLDPAVAGRVFSAFSRSLRETDFIGWYRGERAAGAVLTELGEGFRSELASVVCQRVSDALRAELAPDVVRRLEVRVYRYPELGTGDTGGRVYPLSRVEEPGQPVPDAWMPAVRRALELAVGVVVSLVVYLATLVRAGSHAAVPRERNA